MPMNLPTDAEFEALSAVFEEEGYAPPSPGPKGCFYKPYRPPMNPIQDLLMRGLAVGAGSDSPVTELDPMLGLWALEAHHDPIQRLSRAQAIRLYTVGSAALAHLEEKKGALEPGMQADFAAYDEDPFTVDDPRGIRPVMTVSRGREVFVR